MKKITLALGLAAVMAVGFSSCDTYDIYPEQYGKVMGIKNAGDRDITVYTTDPTSSDTIIVMKGGHNPAGASEVSLRAMTDADWAAYMEETRNEGLLRIPTNCYSFAADADQPEVRIKFNSDKDRYSVHRFYVKSAPLAEWYKEPEVEAAINAGRIPVIPVMLAAVAEGDSVNVDNKYVFYHPDLTAPKLGMTETGSHVKVLNIEDCGEGKFYEPEVSIQLPSQLLWDFQVRTLFNATALDKYKEANPDANDWKVMDKKWFSYDTDKYDYIEPDANKTRTIYHFKKGGDKALNLGIKIDLQYFNPLTDLNTTFVIPLVLLKAVTFEEEGMTEEENAALAEQIGLACQSDTILVSFRVDKVYSMHQLAIDETMLTSNVSESSEGSIAGMFDDDTSTFWHSTWSADIPVSAPFYAYFEINVPEENINMCGFEWTNRGSGNTGVPKVVNIYGSNDGDDWWLIGEMSGCDTAIGTAAGASGSIGDVRHPFISRNEDGSARTFKKVRFCVLETSRGKITTSAGNANYFNCSEFRMLGGSGI